MSWGNAPKFLDYKTKHGERLRGRPRKMSQWNLHWRWGAQSEPSWINIERMKSMVSRFRKNGCRKVTHTICLVHSQRRLIPGKYIFPSKYTKCSVQFTTDTKGLLRRLCYLASIRYWSWQESLLRSSTQKQLCDTGGRTRQQQCSFSARNSRCQFDYLLTWLLW